MPRWTVFLALGLAGALVGCAKAPDLGSPDQRALVIFAGVVRTESALGDAESTANSACLASGGTEHSSTSVNGPDLFSPPVLVFPALAPGRYRLCGMRTERPAGQKKAIITVFLTPEKVEPVQGLTFDLSPGQVHYLGQVAATAEVGLFTRPEISQVVLRDNPDQERKSVETLLKALPPESPWRPRLTARLERLK